MNELISIRHNTIYDRKVDGEGKETFNRNHEIILLVDQPQYKYLNEGEVVRERMIDQLRFIVSDEVLGRLIDLLTELKNQET